jgi:hypothetical protein
MDDIVKQAIAKWPNVPACVGWLGLDARGNWYMRDDGAQAAGQFISDAADPAQRAAARGSRLLHDKLVDFIARNYESDTAGQWFFQNGPQRVFVELEITPLIWRVAERPGFAVTAHTGLAADVLACLLDEQGRVYLHTSAGFGLVHSLDMVHAAEAIEAGVWVPEAVLAHDLPTRFAYVCSPQQRQQVA